MISLPIEIVGRKIKSIFGGEDICKNDWIKQKKFFC